MFGTELDYRLLKRLAHTGNRATAGELEKRARLSSFTLDDAEAYLRRVQQELFVGALPIDPNLTYLDIGCGIGRLSLGLASAGVATVTGIEILERNVRQANILAENHLPPDRRPEFIAMDIHDWQSDEKFDVIIVLGAMEHILDLPRFLRRVPELLKPDGRCFVSIEPFHSPFGDHMQHFFKPYIPWTGLLFNEQGVLRLRREVFRPDDLAERYQDIEGGLNRVRFGRYRRYVREAALDFEKHFSNPQLANRSKVLHAVSGVLTSIPVVRDYFVVADYAVLRHRRA